MIGALEVFCGSRMLTDYVATMGAYVRHASELTLFISRKKERFGKVPIEKNKRANLPISSHRLIVTNPLPALEKNVPTHAFKHLARSVKLSIQRRGFGDVWVDIELLFHSAQANGKLREHCFKKNVNVQRKPGYITALMSTSKNKLGKAATLSLVVGNMVGAGIFLLPSALGAFGGISLFGWLISAGGAFALSVVFGKLSQFIPDKGGGPYVYSKAGFGDFIGFLVAWGYWISIWITNASIAIALVGYLSVFFPILGESLPAVIAGLGVLWLLTWVNTLNISRVGRLQTFSTILKVIPLLLIAIGGLFFINFDHFEPFNSSGESNIAAIIAASTLTLFAFQGLESASIASDKVANSKRVVSIATRVGVLITIVIYILGSASVMGIVPPEQLVVSKAPFADAAEIMWGGWARYLVAGGAVISTFGALNGWIFLQGQLPRAIAQDKLFPSVFKRENKNAAPVLGIVISSVMASILMIMNFQKGLVKAFEFMILLSTLSCLIPYVFSTLSFGLFIITDRYGKFARFGYLTATAIALAFSIWAIIGSGLIVAAWGLILLAAGVPIFLWMKKR